MVLDHDLTRQAQPSYRKIHPFLFNGQEKAQRQTRRSRNVERLSLDKRSLFYTMEKNDVFLFPLNDEYPQALNLNRSVAIRMAFHSRRLSDQLDHCISSKA